MDRWTDSNAKNGHVRSTPVLFARFRRPYQNENRRNLWIQLYCITKSQSYLPKAWRHYDWLSFTLTQMNRFANNQSAESMCASSIGTKTKLKNRRNKLKRMVDKTLTSLRALSHIMTLLIFILHLLMIKFFTVSISNEDLKNRIWFRMILLFEK